MINGDDTFTVLNEGGKEVKCDVLFTFDSEETGKSYIVYTDNSVDDNGNVQVFASIYDPSNESNQLMPIETEQEWRIIKIIIEEIQAELKENGE